MLVMFPTMDHRDSGDWVNSRSTSRVLRSRLRFRSKTIFSLFNISKYLIIPLSWYWYFQRPNNTVHEFLLIFLLISNSLSFSRSNYDTALINRTCINRDKTRDPLCRIFLPPSVHAVQASLQILLMLCTGYISLKWNLPSTHREDTIFQLLMADSILYRALFHFNLLNCGQNYESFELRKEFLSLLKGERVWSYEVTLK